MRSKKGITIIEVMIAVAILCTIAVVVIKLLAPNLTFFQRIQVRQKTNAEARQAMETIQRFLSNANPSSVVWTTPASPAPPNSQIQFDTVGISTGSFTITWSSSPPNSLHILQKPANSNVWIDSVLATHVTGIVFTGDFRDSSVMNVSLQMDAPMDNRGQDSSLYSVFLANQVIRMASPQ